MAQPHAQLILQGRSDGRARAAVIAAPGAAEALGTPRSFTDYAQFSPSLPGICFNVK
ncbi:hypothetical protein Z950_681 [Sulfitobacter mediterraneus KCTC 32188]|nr:hypothetical protein Z950_681 [Sulfitobacter mediterraneus KCTC 32188]